MPGPVHRHQFVETSKIDKPDPQASSSSRTIFGVTIVCVDCGQIRKVYDDGEVKQYPKR